MEDSTLTYNLGNLGFWMCSTGWFKQNCFRSHCSPIVPSSPPLNTIKKLHSWCGRASLSNQMSGLLVPCYYNLEHEQLIIKEIQSNAKNFVLGYCWMSIFFSLSSNLNLTNLQSRVEVRYSFNTCDLIDFNLLRLRSNPL